MNLSSLKQYYLLIHFYKSLFTVSNVLINNVYVFFQKVVGKIVIGIYVEIYMYVNYKNYLIVKALAILQQGLFKVNQSCSV